MRPAHQAREVPTQGRWFRGRRLASMRPAHQAREVIFPRIGRSVGRFCFNEARASSTGSMSATSRACAGRTGFNEARASSTGSSGGWRGACLLRHASMRPAHQAREVPAFLGPEKRSMQCFNEARASSTGSTSPVSGKDCHKAGFNEARASSTGSSEPCHFAGRELRASMRPAHQAREVLAALGGGAPGQPASMRPAHQAREVG